MNWVGGARNRLKMKDEKQRQKEFFEKMRYGNKVRQLSRSSAPQKAKLPASLDLLSLQAADYSATKFRKSDTMKSSKSKVKKVELDRSKGLFPFHHHHDDLELPMSPCAPSKLQLDDLDQRNLDGRHPKEVTPQANTVPFVSPSQQIDQEIYRIKTAEDSKLQSQCSGQSHLSFQPSSPFHSTPMAQEFFNAPQQPLKHQGKHFEDLFFSFVPSDTSKPTQDPPEEFSAISNDGDEFDYSPLSSIPSESSVTSSLTVKSPSSQFNSTIEHNQVPLVSKTSTLPSQGKQLESSRPICSPVDLTQHTASFPIMIDSLPNEDYKSDSSLCGHKRESAQAQKPLDNPGSNQQQVDLMCKEKASFLSPFCKQAEVFTSAQVRSRKRRLGSEIAFSDTQSCEKSASCIGLSESSSNMSSGRAIEKEQKWLRKDDIALNTVGNSFVSGHKFTENSTTGNDERNVSKAPTKAMSKVCEQVLKEVLQLDSELCQHSPLHQDSSSHRGLQPPLMEVINLPVKQNKLEMEKFSCQVAEEKAVDEKLVDGHSKESCDQQVPNQSQELAESTPTGRTPVKLGELQPNASIDESQIQEYTENCEKQGEGNGADLSHDGATEVHVHEKVAYHQMSANNDGGTEESESQSTGTEPDVETLDDHIFRPLCEDQATQCNIYIIPTETKATLCEIQEFTSESQPGNRKIRKSEPMYDAYNECTLS
ncbi:uncharacterized protein LOC110973599 isoform X2 [Acanthaster planci]|uniref:Uncharacterized protein LOC110973599 isoform X2 n=1 Tax=Acanthaster planci TaxID=133434 RepID=A0A8B7XJ96_ACAPL|nr:uncharacterized protein LOC110973599 isoform X2 [Acanthaster planci]